MAASDASCKVSLALALASNCPSSMWQELLVAVEQAARSNGFVITSRFETDRDSGSELEAYESSGVSVTDDTVALSNGLLIFPERLEWCFSSFSLISLCFSRLHCFFMGSS